MSDKPFNLATTFETLDQQRADLEAEMASIRSQIDAAVRRKRRYVSSLAQRGQLPRNHATRLRLFNAW